MMCGNKNHISSYYKTSRLAIIQSYCIREKDPSLVQWLQNKVLIMRSRSYIHGLLTYCASEQESDCRKPPANAIDSKEA